MIISVLHFIRCVFDTLAAQSRMYVVNEGIWLVIGSTRKGRALLGSSGELISCEQGELI